MRTARSLRSALPVGTAALLVAASGTAIAPAAHAAIFTFSQQCASPNWIGECTAGPCVPSGTQTFNNWGRTGCAAGLPLPGAGDTADISGSTVTLNGAANVLEILTNSATNLTWASGNLTLGQPSTMNGSVTMTGATRTFAGTLTNAGSWSDDGSAAVLTVSSGHLSNAASGSWSMSNGGVSRNASSTNSFTNAGTFQKLGPGTSTFNQIGITHSGTLNVAEGTLSLSQVAFPITFSPGSMTSTAPGATLAISSGTLSGEIAGTNAGAFTLTSPALAAPLSIDLPGNPVGWIGGNLSGNGHTLTIDAGTSILVSGAARTSSASHVINDGVWTEDTGGLSTSLSSSTFVNNGTLNFAGQSFLRTGSSNNSVTNNGTWNKSTAILSTVQSMAVNHNGTLNVLEGPMTIAGTFPLTASASSVTNVSPGATLTIGCPITGDIEGTNNGAVIINGVSLAGNATINMGPGQTHMQSTTTTNLNGHTLTMGPATNYRNLTGVTKTFSGGSIVNNGDWLEATGGFVVNLSSAHITNNGTMTLDNTTINRFGSSSNSITNNGTLRKIGAAAVSIVEMHVNNNGLIDVEQGTLARVNTFTYTQNPGGTLRARAGTSVSLSGTSWNGGVLRGLGSISASNFNFGVALAQMTVTPGDPGDEGGTLSLQGNLIMTNDEVLNIELDARPGTPAGHDRLTVSGSYTLGGATLNVSLAPGFIPTLGDQYTIISAGVLSPSTFFGNVNYNLPDGVLFNIQYFNQFVQLTVIGVPCGTSDYNGDGDFGTDADIEAFFACLGGSCCETCYTGGADFNADGDTGTDADIESFFRVLGGGPC